MKVIVTCACGAEFATTEKRRQAGRGKRCSRACAYRYAQRPTGLKYRIRSENPAWFKPGDSHPTGPEAPGWRGEEIGYQQLHRWVRKNKIKPSSCEHCGSDGPLEWANKSREYRRDLKDWLALCRLCHRRYDDGPWRGLATAKYGRDAVQNGGPRR